jgi:translation initiation factor IF-3
MKEKKSVSFDYAVNNQIRTREVRLVGEAGDQQVISTYDALQQARNQGLDLVAINEKSTPPVCKILDYGRFKYEQARKQKELDKKNRESRIELKEIQLRPTIDQNDLLIKAKRAQGFLNEGDKVKLVMRFKGREITHTEVGRQVVQQFLDALTDFKFERPVSMSERQLFAILAPNPKK